MLITPPPPKKKKKLNIYKYTFSGSPKSGGLMHLRAKYRWKTCDVNIRMCIAFNNDGGINMYI